MIAIVGAPGSGTRWFYKRWKAISGEIGYISNGHTVPEPHRTMHIKEFLSSREENKVIHLVRDGRDVVSSRVIGDHGPTDNFEDIKPKDSDGLHNYFAKTWIAFVEKGLIEDDRYLQIRYEDFVKNFKEIYKKIATFCEIPIKEKEMEYFEGTTDKTTIGKYKKNLSKIQVEEITEIMKPMLIKLRYINGSD